TNTTNVTLDAGTIATVECTDGHVVVRNLADAHKDSVSITAGGRTMPLSCGEEVCVSATTQLQKDPISRPIIRAITITRTNPHDIVTHTHLAPLTAEHSKPRSDTQNPRVAACSQLTTCKHGTYAVSKPQ